MQWKAAYFNSVPYSNCSIFIWLSYLQRHQGLLSYSFYTIHIQSLLYLYSFTYICVLKQTLHKILKPFALSINSIGIGIRIISLGNISQLSNIVKLCNPLEHVLYKRQQAALWQICSRVSEGTRTCIDNYLANLFQDIRWVLTKLCNRSDEAMKQ